MGIRAHGGRMADTKKTDLDYADTLWKEAEALRVQVDAAKGL